MVIFKPAYFLVDCSGCFLIPSWNSTLQMSQRSLIWKETLQTAPWMLCSPVEMHLACYGGSYIPALSVVILVLFLSCQDCWLAFGSYPVFPAFFFYALNWLNWLSWQNKPLTYGLVGVEMNPSLLLQQQCTRFAVLIATFALSAVCIRLHLVLFWVTWECCSCQWEPGKATSCHHLTRNLWAFLGLRGWWFWWKDWIWLVKCTVWF